MKVKDVMTSHPCVCSRATNLAEAGARLLAADCGLLPVVEDGTLVGVVTDRDICIALATRDRRASEMTVGDVVQAPVHTCRPEDDISVALDTMREHHVRRLPVEGFAGTVVGVISMNDIVLAADPKNARRDARIIETLQSICAHRHPVATIEAA